MMIYFKAIRFKNFLSYGNQMVEISLSSHHTTLLIGDSGSGKSSVQDALAFVLFGKAFRPINKSQLINASNGKECVVELEFSAGTNEYLIRRGIKPNIFEIIKNGNPIDQVSSSNDQQDYLETNILKTNYKTFCQTIALGIVNYSPFMTMKAAERRALVEEILSIQIFSSMHTLLKERISENKANLLNTTNNIANTTNIALEQKKRIASIKAQRETYVNSLSEELTSLKSKLKLGQLELEKCNEKIKALENDRNEKFSSSTIEKAESKSEELIKLRSEAEIKSSSIKEQIESLKNPTCSLCGALYNKKDTKHSILVLKDALKSHENGLSEISSKISCLPDQIDRDSYNKEIAEIKVLINTLSISLKNNERHIELHKKGKCPTCEREFDGNIEDRISSLENECVVTTSLIEQHNLNIQKIKNILDEDLKVSEEKKKLEKRIKEHESSIKTCKISLTELESKLGCHACIDLDETTTRTKIEEYQKNLDMLKDSIESLNSMFLKNKSFLQEATSLGKQIDTEVSARTSIENSLDSLKETIKLTKQKIKDLSDSIPEIDEATKELSTTVSRISELSSLQELQQDKSRIFSIANDLLKDTGIKSIIIENYIPVINHYVNKYLAAMNFNVIFELDKNFEEKIQSRGVDTLTYSSMSEGERQRLDIAILLTWRTIAMLKNSVNTNLLFVDEILDCSLDQSTTENIVDLMTMDPTLSDSNLMIISHKPALADKFQHCLKFEKGLQGFSSVNSI